MNLFRTRSVTALLGAFLVLGLATGSFSVAAVSGDLDSARGDGMIRLKYATFSPLQGEPAMDQELMAQFGYDIRLVQVKGPLTSDEILSLEDAGAQLLGYMADFTYIAQVSDSVLSSLEAMPTVNWVGHYHPAYKIQSGLLERTESKIRVNVVIFTELDGAGARGDLKAELKRLEGEIAYEDDVSSILQVVVAPSGVASLARLPQVSWIDRWDPPVAQMNLVRPATGASTVASNGYNGSGIVGEVKDNGIQQGHPDFGNLIGTYGGPVVDSHGTCTFGIIFGDGSNSSNATGMMPGGSGVFADWYTGRQTSISNLVNTWDGVFQSNSWSQGSANGDYTSYSQENDQAIVSNDAMMFYSAGNYGTSSNTTSQDSSAKNVVCVGAVYHQNTSSFGDDQWENNGSGNTPAQGPTDDGRIKPDICGWFDSIYTTDRTGSSGYSSGDYTSSFGGTSAACPIVAGGAGLIYDMYEGNHFGNNPSSSTPHAATVKALLIANAYQYSLSDATRYQQGWGLVDVGQVYDAGVNQLIVDEGNPLSTGMTWDTTVVRLSSSDPLKITLAWMDEPGEASSSTALINDLDLRVTSPGGTVYRGNVGLTSNLWSNSGGSADRKNNVENVFIQNPESGTYTIEVVGYNVAQDNDPASGVNQDFALVATMIDSGVCVDDGYEENDSFGTAHLLLAGTFSDLKICDGDADYYRFNVTAAGSSIQVDSNFTHANGNLDLYLYNPSQTQIDSSTSSTDNETVSATSVGTTGYYYARVTGVGSAENDYQLVITVIAPTDTIHVTMGCVPTSGTLPYTLTLWPQLCNDDSSTRTLYGRISVVIASGTSYNNWRSGSTNVGSGGCYVGQFNVDLPNYSSLRGNNVFTLFGEDITAPPYNQPPYTPSGDTDTLACTSVGN